MAKALSDENELLAVREPDWQDTAATSSAIVVLDSISEQERHARTIQASLARIEHGGNGSGVLSPTITSSAFARSPNGPLRRVRATAELTTGQLRVGRHPRHPARR